jgi:5-methylthioadenosine/S-adenosylhomocysteine deaminase
VAWLDCLGVLQPGTLCIHAVQLSRRDIGVLAERAVAIAHCPVSNAAHRHGSAPLAALRQAGIRMGIGTDSVASVGSLDLFREARAAQALGGLSDPESLALATLEGARALGLEREVGSLRAGKWGDLLAVRVAAGGSELAPVRAVLHASPAAVTLTVLGGRVVHRVGPA